MLGNEQSGRCCQINQNSHQIARMAFIYGRQQLTPLSESSGTVWLEIIA